MKPIENTPRILFLSDHLGHGEGMIHGASTYFLNVLPLLKRSDVPLTVCFLRARHPVADRLEDAGVTPLFLGRGKWDPRALRDVVRLIQEHDINLVHAAGMKGILISRLAARRTGVHCVAHLHDANTPDPIMKTLQRLTARWTDGCLCISRAVADYAVRVLDMPPDRVQVLYNPLPGDPLEPATPDTVEALRTAWQLEGKRALALIGRMSPEKGHEPFLRGAADWLAARPDVRLILVGDGPLRESLQAMVHELGLEGAVRFAGYREDVAVILQLLDAVLVPSVREGLGYVALEAMAAGCPVAAFRVGGLPELVEDGETGMLSPPADVPHMLSQLDRLLGDPALRDRLICGGKAKAQGFSTQAHVEELGRIYRRVLSQGARGGNNR